MLSFCSRTALASHEGLAGTAVRGEAYVFLPVPKRLWHSSELNTSWASRPELDAIRAVRKAGIVARLYNPPQGQAEPAPVLVHVSPGRPRPPALEDFLALFVNRGPAEASPRSRLAVCTHGTRDRCCAKWGFAVWREAKRLYDAGLSPFEPIECSHLGGDRFAATGVLFPGGSMYAHLDSADLATLLAAEAKGRIVPEHYRGGVFEPQLVQIVRAGLAREGLFNDLAAPLAVEPDPGRKDLAHALAGDARFAVSLAEVKLAFYGSCEDLAHHRLSTARRTVYVGGRAV